MEGDKGIETPCTMLKVLPVLPILPSNLCNVNHCLSEKNLCLEQDVKMFDLWALLIMAHAHIYIWSYQYTQACKLIKDRYILLFQLFFR